MRPPNQRPGTSVRWLLLSWAALFIMSLLIPLVTGAGVFGMILFLAAFLLTALLCLLLWGVARLWRRGRSRICNCLRIVALLLLFCTAALVFVGGGRYDHPLRRGQRPIAPARPLPGSHHP